MMLHSFLLSKTFNKKAVLSAFLPSLGALGAIQPGKFIDEYKIMVNYNGQADLLLSLQIPPDYYPYQFKKTSLYDYLTNVEKYLVVNEHTSAEKTKLKTSLQNKITSLLSRVKEFGPSLWNEDLYDTGIVFRNNQFWNSKKTSLLFIEQFIADDYTDIRDSYNLLPAHKKLIVTNYRASRDPYTIFSKNIFECFKSDGSCENWDKQVGDKFKKYIKEYKQVEANSLYRFGRFIEFWNSLMDKSQGSESQNNFQNFIKDSKLFSVVEDEDKKLAQKYINTIFTKEEKQLLDSWIKGDTESKDTETQNWQAEYLKKSSSPSPQKAHHPALEQQILPGTAPLAEGSQKDIMVFLYQFASLIDKYTKESKDDFEKTFANDYRKSAMENALNNANLMSKNIEDRIKKIREYFKTIGVVDNSYDPDKSDKSDKGNSSNTNSKTFTILTYPPSAFGAGEATIQSMSKFPFIYRDIGLKQPIPNNLSANDVHQASDTGHQHDLSHEMFSVDDNGWWWKIGSANLDPTNLLKFKNSADTLLILANEDDWNLLQDKTSGTLTAASTLLKDSSNGIEISKIQGNEKNLINNKGYHVSYNKYHLWNEGLRSPIALNLLLDNLVDIFQRQYDSTFSKEADKCKYKEAMDWGEYWTTHFINGTNASAGNSSQS